MYFACARDNRLFLVYNINANVSSGYIDLSEKPIELELDGEIFSKTVPDVLGIGWYCPWSMRTVVETILGQLIQGGENNSELFNSLGSIPGVELIVVSHRWLLTKTDVSWTLYERLHRSYTAEYDADPIFLRVFKNNPGRSVADLRAQLMELSLLSTAVVFREYPLPPMGTEKG